MHVEVQKMKMKMDELTIKMDDLVIMNMNMGKGSLSNTVKILHH